jgi:hypothetical protein
MLYEANSGGPSSRSRSEIVKSSVLGRADTTIRCPRTFTLALDFGAADPRRTMDALLRRRRMRDPAELKARYALPGPMLCIVNMNVTPLAVASADPDSVLRIALLLGLSTATFFDPARPVLWTTRSLQRRLQLYDMAGFYA